METPPAPKIRFKPRIEVPPPAEASSQPGASPTPEGAPNSFAGVIPPSAMANPHVIAPSPPLFATPPAPTNAPPLFAPDTPPAAPTPTPAAASDSGKFKLKPKLSPSAPPPASEAGAPPFVFAPPPVMDAAAAFAPPPPATPAPVMLGGIVVKAPPPFPVMAPAGSTASALPGGEQKIGGAETAAPVAAPRVPERRRGSGSGLLKLVALIVLAGAGYFAWTKFKPAPATPAPAANAAPVKKAPVSAPANPATTPSETLNEIAHAPKKAIDKAQEAIAARRASGQSRIDAAAIGEDLPDTPVAPPPAPVTPSARPAAPRAAAPTTTSTIAPGVSATAQVEAAAEASAPFRTFVANAKVSGVFQGPPTRAMINGRLIRAGELVDGGLGITFTGVDSPRRQLIFQDKTGATVSRRF